MSTEPIVLTAAEARVLGSLVEKEITTPEYYPLSLNALVNACNQRSNREPVMNLEEDDARQALRGLEEKRLAGAARGAESRVTKYQHWLGEVFNFSRAEAALLCVLLLRGPQTTGELRARTERMHRFEEISDVAAGLQKLMDREPPLAAILPRQAGAREARYTQLLSASAESIAASASDEAGIAASAASSDDREERITRLEREVSELRRGMAELRKKLDDLFA